MYSYGFTDFTGVFGNTMKDQRYFTLLEACGKTGLSRYKLLKQVKPVKLINPKSGKGILYVSEARLNAL